MPTKYWVIFNIETHSKHPVSHHYKTILKTYFDEDVPDKSDHTIEKGKFFSVPSEHKGGEAK